MKRFFLTAVVSLLLAARAGPQVTRVLPLTATADAPYDNILVACLFEFFDSRRYFESAIVDQARAIVAQLGRDGLLASGASGD